MILPLAIALLVVVGASCLTTVTVLEVRRGDPDTTRRVAPAEPDAPAGATGSSSTADASPSAELARSGSWVEDVMRESIVVHTKDNRSLRGALVAVYADELVLEHAVYLAASGAEQLAGQVSVPRANVSFTQRIPVEVAA